ncbi:alpha/beta hydrolase [Acuticoccus sp. I52.16.1]|uniref:alpha/beta hydrolase n=1 Tax=Acuticoccus sp. I52.16.1 TaxID=2928472 RepID=UPI001FD1DE0D|nr:alpha/beta fold hydrolase [Acuticoccus sp. I52.16.1]UOM36033.1 prolyl oligopeptidase family serine peptidase [Acuticoccus sp. I52.16.1]
MSGKAPAAIVMFVHGYGADGSDLIGLADQLAPLLPDALFLSPDAPGRMAHGGREWFPLTMRDPSEYKRGVEAAAPALDRYIDAELARYGLDDGRLALVGFSQGTMMSLQVAYRRSSPIAAVVGFSGLCAGADGAVNPAPTLLIHGTHDEVLPAGMTLQASQTLGEAGIPVEWHFRPGLGHGIDPDGLAMAGDHLATHLSKVTQR